MSKSTAGNYIEAILAELTEYFARHGKLVEDVCAEYLAELKAAEQNGLRAMNEVKLNER